MVSKLSLYKNKRLRSFVAGLLLIIFAFSVTPTIVLHNWLANHTDSVRKLPDTGQTQVAKQLFNCHCDNIVAESAFTETASIIITVPGQLFTVQQNCSIIHLPSSPHFYFSQRGPPVV